MKSRKVIPRSREKLEALTTPRLLAVLKQLNRCENSVILSDRTADDLQVEGMIEFKDNPQWIAEYNLVKDILSRREHIPVKVR